MRRFHIGIPLAWSMASLLACGTPLARERLAWEHRRPAAYTFEYTYACFCPGSGAWWRIAVEGDSVTRTELMDSSQAGRGLNDARTMHHPTLTGLFDQIASRAAAGGEIYSVTYDPILHYPVRAQGRDPTRTDSRWTIEVRNVQTTGGGAK